MYNGAFSSDFSSDFDIGIDKGGLFLPSKFVQAPELLIPGRKPRGRVAVSQPYSRRVISAYLFRPVDGSAAVDVVSNTRTQLAPGMELTANGLSLVNHTAVVDLPVPAFSNARQFTFVLIAKKTTGTFSSLQALCAYKLTNQGLDDALLFYPWDTNNGNGARVYYDNATRINQDAAATHGDSAWHVFVITGAEDSVTEARLYIDGKMVGAAVPTGTTQIATPPYSLAVGGWHGNTQLISDVYVDSIFLLDGNISSSEVMLLSHDPYQFLKPIGSAW